MEFEELALNSIDPSLGPTITRPDLAGKKSGEIQQGQVKVSVHTTKAITVAHVFA